MILIFWSKINFLLDMMKITTMLLKASGYVFLVSVQVSSITIWILFENTEYSDDAKSRL